MATFIKRDYCVSGIADQLRSMPGRLGARTADSNLRGKGKRGISELAVWQRVEEGGVTCWNSIVEINFGVHQSGTLP